MEIYTEQLRTFAVDARLLYPLRDLAQGTPQPFENQARLAMQKYEKYCSDRNPFAYDGYGTNIPNPTRSEIENYLFEKQRLWVQMVIPAARMHQCNEDVTIRQAANSTLEELTNLFSSLSSEEAQEYLGTSFDRLFPEKPTEVAINFVAQALLAEMA